MQVDKENVVVVLPSTIKDVDPIIESNLPVTVTRSTENQEFQRQVLTQLSIISAKLNEQAEILDILMKQNSMAGMKQQPAENIDNILALLPLASLNALAEIENLLTDTKVFNAMTKELSRVGGGDVKTLTKRILYRTLSNEVGQLFSWDGAKGKKAFKKHAISQVVPRAVRINPRTQGEDEDIIITSIKSWLVRAKDRLNNKLRRTLRDSSDLGIPSTNTTEEPESVDNNN